MAPILAPQDLRNSSRTNQANDLGPNASITDPTDNQLNMLTTDLRASLQPKALAVESFRTPTASGAIRNDLNSITDRANTDADEVARAAIASGVPLDQIPRIRAQVDYQLSATGTKQEEIQPAQADPRDDQKTALRRDIAIGIRQGNEQLAAIGTDQPIGELMGQQEALAQARKSAQLTAQITGLSNFEHLTQIKEIAEQSMEQVQHETEHRIATGRPHKPPLRRVDDDTHERIQQMAEALRQRLLEARQAQEI